jgi:hypothetical protein
VGKINFGKGTSSKMLELFSTGVSKEVRSLDSGIKRKAILEFEYQNVVWDVVCVVCNAVWIGNYQNNFLAEGNQCNGNMLGNFSQTVIYVICNAV